MCLSMSLNPDYYLSIGRYLDAFLPDAMHGCQDSKPEPEYGSNQAVFPNWTHIYAHTGTYLS